MPGRQISKIPRAMLDDVLTLSEILNLNELTCTGLIYEAGKLAPEKFTVPPGSNQVFTSIAMYYDAINNLLQVLFKVFQGQLFLGLETPDYVLAPQAVGDTFARILQPNILRVMLAFSERICGGEDIQMLRNRGVFLAP